MIIDVAIKLLATNFLHRLFELGRKRTELWLEEHFEDLGKRDTVDIEEMYL